MVQSAAVATRRWPEQPKPAASYGVASGPREQGRPAVCNALVLRPFLRLALIIGRSPEAATGFVVGFR